jgi:signal transduction histidine kinase
MMPDQVIDGLLMLLPAAAHATIAWQDRGEPATTRSRWRPIAHPGTLFALSFVLAALPYEAHPGPSRIAAYVLGDALTALGIAGYAHLARRRALPAEPPRRRWLVANYGPALAVCLLAAAFPLIIPLPTFGQQLAVYHAIFLTYYLTTAGRALGWLVGPAGGPPGVGLFAFGMVLEGGGWTLLTIAGAFGLFAPLAAAIGLMLGAPFARRRVEAAIRWMLVVVAGVAAARLATSGIEALDAFVANGHRLAAPSPILLVGAALSAFQALVWGICARIAWRARRRLLVTVPFTGLLPVLMTCMAAFFVLDGVRWLLEPLSPPLPAWLSALSIARDWLLLAAIAVAVHAVRLFPAREARPSARAIGLSYGLAAVIGLGSVLLFDVVPASSVEERIGFYTIAHVSYVIGAVCFILHRLIRRVQPGAWWRGEMDLVAGRTRRADVLLYSLAAVATAVSAWVLVARPLSNLQPSWIEVSLGATTGFAVLIPIAVSTLGEVVRGLVASLTALAIAALAFFALEAIVRPLAAVGFGGISVAVAAALVSVAMIPVWSRVRAAFEWVLFRRSRSRRTELLAFLQRLPPEQGTRACAQQALSALVEIVRCRGAAILLADGDAISQGAIQLEPLRRGWVRETARATLPGRVLVGYDLAALPQELREVAGEAGVSAVLALRSPRRHWGHLFIAVGLLGTAFRDEDIEAAEAFADQLALVLDTAELLERAVTVERTLAHAEKLAAVGETAARIAHDIRNPVTAARSLAQQLARDGGPADRDAAAVILGELDRVERQVAALLRFSRREDFRFEPVDLGTLARVTLEPLRSRLEAAQVRVELDAPEGIVARADGEKMRQVIVNLVENALDALRDTSAPRRIIVSVSGDDGVARLRVSDNGPGVAADVLPRLFEPFFSLKPSGTGLGLAIAKRTVDAHGGRIMAASAPGTGLGIDIEMPLARAA